MKNCKSNNNAKIIDGLEETISYLRTMTSEVSERCIQYQREAIAMLKEQEAEIERLKRPDCEHANHDGAGCLGYCGCEQDDEPIDACKQCEKYTGNICAEY